MLHDLDFWCVIYLLAMGIISFNQLLIVYFLINDYFYLKNEGGDQESINNVPLLYSLLFWNSVILVTIGIAFFKFSTFFLFVHKKIKIVSSLVFSPF